MSANRKLQTEIERTLKKVEEGVEIFDEIWDKVYSATQQNQKEKYEVDLKKEIKKLQRHRDQIKTWAASSDIKDKRPLTDARKLIETKMEQFKVCEKETKTKTYSKEGLARETKVDPHEAAKNSTRDWLSEKVDALMLQIDMHEADMEKLTTGKTTKKNKLEVEALEGSIKRHRWHIAKLEQITRLLDNDVLQHEQINEIKEDVEYYIDANQEPDFMDAYDETMDIFESLDLGDDDVMMAAAAAAASGTKDGAKGGAGGDATGDKKKPASSSKAGKKGGDGDGSDDDDAKDDKKKRKKKEANEAEAKKKKEAEAKAAKEKLKSSTTAGLPLTIGRATTKAAAPTLLPGKAAASAQQSNKPVGGGPVASSAMGGSPAALGPAPVTTHAAPPAESLANILLKQQAQAPPASLASGGIAMADRLRQQQAFQQQQLQQQLQQQQQQQQLQLQFAAQRRASPSSPAPSLGSLGGGAAAAAAASAAAAAEAASSKPPQPPGSPFNAYSGATPSLTTVGAVVHQRAAVPPPMPDIGGSPGGGAQPQPTQTAVLLQGAMLHGAPVSATNAPAPRGAASFGGVARGSPTPSVSGGATTTTRGSTTTTSSFAASSFSSFAPGASLEPLLDVTDQALADDTYSRLRGAREAASAAGPDSTTSQLEALALSMCRAPRRADSERPRQYVPRNPYATPAAFPSTPASTFDDSRVFEKLGTDTLFFIFYYQQGTYQQYLAARELKKQSWRYHKKYMTWFQRHEEPKVTTDEFEQGTYVYFDYETGWCQRIKTDFTFEYNFLEDELVT